MDRFAPSTYQVSVVVPVFNGAATLEELTERVMCVARRWGGTWELVLVDDGSTDGSWNQIRQLSRNFPEVRGLSLDRNVGQHAATLAGILEARFSRVITLDDDLEFSPEAIPLLLEELDRGNELVYGILPRSTKSVWRKGLSRLAHGILDPATQSGRTCSSFRAFFQSESLTAPLRSRRWHTLDSLFNGTVERISCVAVPSPCTENRPSRYRWPGLSAVFLNGVTGITGLPLNLLLPAFGGVSATAAAFFAASGSGYLTAAAVATATASVALYVAGEGQARCLRNRAHAGNGVRGRCGD